MYKPYFQRALDRLVTENISKQKLSIGSKRRNRNTQLSGKVRYVSDSVPRLLTNVACTPLLYIYRLYNFASDRPLIYSFDGLQETYRQPSKYMFTSHLYVHKLYKHEEKIVKRLF